MMQAMEFVGVAILSLFFTFAVPIIIIVIIVRLLSRHQAGATGRGVNRSVTDISPRQITLGVLAGTVIYAGAVALYNLPTWLFNVTDDGTVFGLRLLIGVLVLGFGLLVMRRRLISIILMGLGVLNLLLATPYIFTNFGSVGILLVVMLVFAVLIFLTMRLHKKGRLS